jgi:hypothetical protein
MYQCSENVEDFFEFYHPQSGRGFEYPAFQANLRRQKGSGIGGIFQKLGRYLIPFLRNVVLPHAKKAVRNVVVDLVDHEKAWKDSVKEQGINALKGIGSQILSQSGGGLHPIKIIRKPAVKKTHVKRKQAITKKQPTKKKQTARNPGPKKKLRSIFD